MRKLIPVKVNMGNNLFVKGETAFEVCHSELIWVLRRFPRKGSAWHLYPPHKIVPRDLP